MPESWRLMPRGEMRMRRLMRPLGFLLAVAFLLEAWLWEQLGPLVARIVALFPLEQVRRGLTSLIARLPPHATLLVFVIPGLLIVPFKLAGIWLLTRGHILAGAMTFLAAKALGLGVTAFLFELCRDKLLRIGWFLRFYRLVLRLRAWAQALIEPARVAIRAGWQYIVGADISLLRRLSRLRARVWHRRFSSPR